MQVFSLPIFRLEEPLIRVTLDETDETTKTGENEVFRDNTQHSRSTVSEGNRTTDLGLVTMTPARHYPGRSVLALSRWSGRCS